VAEALGAIGITVDKKADVPNAIKKMLNATKPCVVDFKVASEENVWPMVPAGKAIDEMSGLDILESMA
jgi:acetolactate synthase-1/2/3 large subunit